MDHEDVVNPAHVPILLAAILFILVLFIPTIQGDFVWHDRILLLELSTPAESSALQPLMEQTSVLSGAYFRPVPLAMFNVELRLWGANAALLHLVNLLLHLTNTVLVMWIALILIKRNDLLNEVRWLAILVGLLYAVHPVMVESVAFISGRIDLLLTLFLLLALLADLQLRQRNLARVAAVTIAFLLAMLTKETAIVFIAVLVAWHLATRDQNSPRREALMIYTGVLAVSLLYLGFRYFVLGYPQLAASASAAYAGSALQKLLMTVRSLGEFLLLLVWPFTGLTPIHFVSLPIPINDPVTWFYAVFLLTLLLVVIWSVHKMPAAGWLAVAGVVALLPASILGPLSPWSGSIITERSLVFPLALLSLAAIPGIYYMLLWRQTHSTSSETSVPAILGRQFMTPGTTIIGLWLIACSITVALTIPYWRTDLTLWSWASQRAPRSPVPAANLVLAYSSLGAYPSALAASERALQLDDTNVGAWINHGMVLFVLGQYSKAQSAFETASELDPENLLVLNNLASTLREQGALQEAEKILRDRVLNREPTFAYAHLNLALVYLQADRPDLAATHLQEVIKLGTADPDEIQQIRTQVEDPQRWLRLGYLLLEHEGAESARAAFEQAESLGASPKEVEAGRATIEGQMGSGK